MKKWTLTKRSSVFKTSRMEGVEVTYCSDIGDKLTHTIITSQPSVLVIVHKENKIAFIRQFRTTKGKYYIEIPGGVRNPNESMIETANREVREEVGIIVKDTTILINGPSLLDPSKSDEDFGVAEANFAKKCDCLFDECEQIDEELIWLEECEVFMRLYRQMEKGTPFFEELYLSGHSMYALLAYYFQNNLQCP